MLIVKLEAQNNQKSDIQNSKSFHPSQEKFIGLEEFANLRNEKSCPYEPTAKPCDRCAMCNSHGF